ncbi:bifunctional transcriptional activator/DNA repair enzyme AdaA [Poritiphilus flavus]|uniref:Methylated-DNA--protein-cysteine methyltransferase n=1 Tax=Poritiphilus flavus TaxID=2697053 RepID=A0A6L9EEK1_9FLAO|nr:bifunctional transcriptional activator/DNA repair protein Ada [Poritiphilus flavus]NAS13012.1 methylated-DNA--[protein]-cysteine S-methyltransferase [Poritiphilus flavus]
MKVTIEDNSRFNEFYQALLDRNPQYVGIFFVGVKTTSVFCISTCRARKPHKENVEFFPTFREALLNGFRPCKVCRPTENANQAPSHVMLAIEMVKKSPKEKVSDETLRQNGLNPFTVRRWFKKNYGITFQAYQRMFRINNAIIELQSGSSSTHTAFDSGYDSLSGFGYTYKKLVGKSPTKSDDRNVILIDRLTTPLGPMFVCATDMGICLLEFTDRKMLETEFNDLQKRLNAVILSGENSHTKQLKRELEEYFQGIRKSFEVSLETPGTQFQRQVWQMLQEIPYGQTSTYQQQAIKLQNEKATRAVARANGMNRVSIVIPCHRVIGKDAKLTGYGGGLARKKWLLDFEKKSMTGT